MVIVRAQKEKTKLGKSCHILKTCRLYWFQQDRIWFPTALTSLRFRLNYIVNKLLKILLFRHQHSQEPLESLLESPLAVNFALPSARFLSLLRIYKSYNPASACTVNVLPVSHTYYSSTANLYSQFTVICCVTFPTVTLQWLLQPMAAHMTLTTLRSRVWD